MCLPSNQSDRHESLFLSLYLSTASVTLVNGGLCWVPRLAVRPKGTGGTPLQPVVGCL